MYVTQYTNDSFAGSMMCTKNKITSSVLSVNVLEVPKVAGSIPLVKPLAFTLQHDNKTQLSHRKCVYWDFEGEDWSSDGCFLVGDMTTENATACQCYHLTNFAVLVDVHAMAMDENYRLGLEILTFIGCTISIFCLIVCLIVFSTFRSARNERSSINFNICLCILLAEFTFICGIGQTENVNLCFAVSISLHYLFLASFFWMLIAGFQIYVLLVEVFEQDNSRLVQYYMLGYISPLLIVLCSLLFDTLLNVESVYGGPDYCWLTNNMFLLLSFILPITGIILTNLYFLGIAGWRLHKHYSSSPLINRTRTSSLKSYISGLCGLVSMMGVTWSLGLISVMYPSQILTYSFTVVNASQGLTYMYVYAYYIFMFH